MTLLGRDFILLASLCIGVAFTCGALAGYHYGRAATYNIPPGDYGSLKMLEPSERTHP